MRILILLLCFKAFDQALSKAWLPPPQNIHFDSWQLTWTNATKDTNVSYTVEYKSSNIDWEVVPACDHITVNSCNVSFMKASAEHGCAMLRVQAERHGLTSIPVEACSIHGDTCIPEPHLTTRPGSMTIHLSRNHSLAVDYADHAKHMVYFGREGQPLEEYKAASSSVTINDLEEGQRYCVKVEYIVYYEPKGLASCVQCELIPVADSKHTAKIIAGVVAILVLVVVVPITAYILIFHSKKIKQCLGPPYEMPEVLEQFHEQYITLMPSSPSDEPCNVITSITSTAQ
ncbi:interferon gamma receptor 2 [Parambassis ranga]|uniref:Interferon gamma receptor 2 n=1 Tax=Parambassis ranga TaxID=210632 RepID=A0A6P7H4V5_9TELE|nr:interferon alpha/beta receptor 1-like [Parambassis ranga]